jgi:pSer/pThr/pTyr-binding forkhead associated (FHA) protein
VSERSTDLERKTQAPIRTLKVEVIKGPDKGKSVVDNRGSVTIGTAAGNDLVLTDETVSRYHLELERCGDRIAVQDHGSTNGTAVGPMLIEKRRSSSCIRATATGGFAADRPRCGL